LRASVIWGFVMEFDYKTLLIDAICGRGTGSMENSDAMTQMGLAEFCGNQWNEDWRWKRDKLAELEIGELSEIYRRVLEWSEELKSYLRGEGDGQARVPERD
jgi:hypothetical protein